MKNLSIEEIQQFIDEIKKKDGKRKLVKIHDEFFNVHYETINLRTIYNIPLDIYIDLLIKNYKDDIYIP